MTIYVVVAVKDLALRAFGRPAFVPNAEVGIRSFGDEINRQSLDNTMYLHPADYELWNLGAYDDDSGTFNGHGPALLARGAELAITKVSREV